MVYEDNPFNSSQGKALMKEIFDLMFVAPPKNPSQIESTSKIKQVSYYRSNIVNIVNKMRKFVKGYEQIVLSETEGSGILVCPKCYRRDAIWYWETVDAGHYASPEDWLSSVELKKWEEGGVNEQGRWLFMVRYRCNHVTTCNDCNVTWTGHNKSTCHNTKAYIDSDGKPQTKKCNSSDLAKVGCGEESFARHFVRLYTGDDNIPQEDGSQTGATETNMTLVNEMNRRIRAEGEITGYKFVHNMVPNGKILNDWKEVLEYTPKIDFTISHPDMVTKVVECPVTELTFAVSKQNQVQCAFGKIISMKNGRAVKAHGKQPKALRTARNDPPQPFQCPDNACKATDYPPLQEIYNLYYRPYPMKIMNSQPLSGDASGGTFRGKPVFNLYLESPVADAFKLVLPLPMEFSLNAIPRSPQVQKSGSGVPACPNDVGAGVEGERIMDELNENLQETIKELQEDAIQNRSGIVLTDACAQTSPGYTFDVCEGRSREAVLDPIQDLWIDQSPDCSSYIDNKNGETMAKIRNYPRWSEIPKYAGGDSNTYLGPNPKTHIIQDWLKGTKSLLVSSAQSPIYHYVHQIAERVDVDMGTRVEVMECSTCKNIVAAGGCIEFRQQYGQCDELGKAIDEFPQAVIDAELEYQNSYPLENTLGEPVPTAWGIYAQKDHDGQKMLLNPNLNIKIG